MPREWGRFWIAFAIMVLAGAIVFGAILKQPFNVGSIGQWASAVGTTVAVWVALANTRRTLRDTERRERDKQLAADRAFVGAVVSLSENISDMIETLATEIGDEDVSPQLAQACLDATNLEGLIAAVDRLPLHQSPNVFYIRRVDSIRTAAHNTTRVIGHLISSGENGPVNLTLEKDLALRTVARLQGFALTEGHID